jgi:hypothetical protein
MTDIRDQIDTTVFSLVCENCDAGTDMLNQIDARAAGWTQIEYAPTCRWPTLLAYVRIAAAMCRPASNAEGTAELAPNFAAASHSGAAVGLHMRFKTRLESATSKLAHCRQWPASHCKYRPWPTHRRYYTCQEYSFRQH